MAKFSKNLSLGVDSATGKRIRKRIHSNTKAGLRQAEIEAIASMKDDGRPSEIRLGTYADDWLKAYKASREAATIGMYQTAINKLKPIREKKLQNVRALDLQLVINDHAEYPTACEQLKLTLNQIFKRAMKDGIIRKNPAEDLEVPVIEKKSERALTEKELKAIKAANLEPMERIYVQLLYYFGLRPQEALALMPTDFDFKAGELVIRRAVGYDGNTPYIKTTKTRKVRRIPIPDSFTKDVKKYLSALKKQHSLYLVHSDGELMRKSTKRILWNRIKEKLNVKLGGNKTLDMTNGLRPYTFRHNFCCDCYYAKLSILKTAELMGNSPEMVMKVYTHLDNSKEPLQQLKTRAM